MVRRLLGRGAAFVDRLRLVLFFPWFFSPSLSTERKSREGEAQGRGFLDEGEERRIREGEEEGLIIGKGAEDLPIVALVCSGEEREEEEEGGAGEEGIQDWGGGSIFFSQWSKGVVEIKKKNDAKENGRIW